MQRGNTKKIETILAAFRNFSPEKPISNAVVYYCESHTDNIEDKKKHQATIELIYKEFDMHSCEKYEVRTGYLNRYNCLPKSMNECSEEEIEEAVIRSKQVENDWVNRCNPELPGFKLRDWRDCISEEENPYFEDCNRIIVKKLAENQEFFDSFSATIDDYAEKRGKNIENGKAYILEELTWMLSLPLLHINKKVYLIHVGIHAGAIKTLFRVFPNLQKSTKYLEPKFSLAIFENKSDFLMDYRNGNHLGYSYAMENKSLVTPILKFQKDSYSTKEELLRILEHERTERDLLSSVIAKIPGHVYWLSRDNVYLGCSDLQAERNCLKSRNEIVGKTNGVLYKKEDADLIDKNNTRVMETGIEYEGEEVSIDGVSYLTRKTPLYDAHGKIVGLLGVSIDITDQKRAALLEIENKTQKKIGQLSQQVAHDIQTPLAVLSMFSKSCKNLSESDHITLRNIEASIRNVASQWLVKSEDEIEERLTDPIEQYISVPHSLSYVIDTKKSQYSNTNMVFNFVKSHDNPFIFIRGDFSNYCRMMSNLINNAVEAMGGMFGTVDIGFELKGQDVEIYVKDRGNGMPQKIVDSILSGVNVETTKETGHGIGLQQIKKTIEQMNGKMQIESKENEGTKFTLTFQRSESPPWFIEKIVLPKGFLIIILDDDKSMHGVWKKILESFNADISVKFFSDGDETVDFINSSQEKNKIFLITDYDLRNQDICGTDVIEKCGLQKRSILATSCQISKIADFPRKAEYLKLLEKAFIDIVPIVLEEAH